MIIVVVFGLLFLFFTSVAMAMWLNELLESAALGFLIVGALYVIIGIVIAKFSKNRLQHVLQNVLNRMLHLQE